jgi:hypothetical protein
MRTRIAALALAWLLVAPLAGGAPEDGWWTQRLTFGEGPALVENLWCKGRRMRAESVFDGNPILTLIDEHRYVIIDRLRGTGISIGRSPTAIQQDAKRRRPFAEEAERLMAQGAEKVGTEVRAGQDVDHYRITTSGGDRSEVWLTQDELRLPMEELFRDRQTGAKSQRVYLRWVQAGFPDAFFEPEPGVKLEELSYQEYLKRTQQGPVGPAPPFYAELLHGLREESPSSPPR